MIAFRWFAFIAIHAFCLIGAQAIAQEQPSGSGTGFYVTSDGWIVTNAHVVENCARIKVVGRGEVAEWKIDAKNDLATLQSPGATTAPIPVRGEPRLGEDVAALGYPLASILSSSIKITTGNINSLLGMADDTRYLQISAPVQPGNSGGPVVDRSGHLVGVVTAGLKAGASGDSSVPPQNVNFAIKASVLEIFLQSRGIAFLKADTLENTLTTADLAERIAPSVVQLLCYAAEKSATAPPVQSETRPVALEPFKPLRQLDNRDVIGFDYATLKDVSGQQCLDACKKDSRCLAATYNKPAKYCFLKNGAAVTVVNRDALGIISADIAAGILETGFAIASDRDKPGGDYMHLRQSSFVGCFVACAQDQRCLAFSYVRKNHSCWLKARAGATVRRTGVDLGVK
ncbi:MAG: trypsin-like peptidase domain-containing protein [Rhizobiaceae bacterium]|nr:trypsin-like peptidase domain-containing protein [Rhizobiaceae bacterium]